MRLLHTSDWHLGRSLHRCDLRDAQAAHLDHLVDVVRSERVDAVLVAGDVYDRAVPSLDAVALYDDALVRLTRAGARVVIISGNHDSASRLGVGSRLLDGAGVHVRTRPQDCGVPVLLPHRGGQVAVYGLPYLEPEAVRAVLPPDPGRGEEVPRGHAGVLGRAMDCVRADLSRRRARSVVLAHAWVTGGQGSDSERDITVGGVGHVAAGVFDGVDYVALGHLHGPQVLREGLRYAGSPLAYSFSEAGQVKGSWLVELDGRGLSRVEHVPSPVPRRLTVLRGALPDLLTSREHDGAEDDWVSVLLTDAVRPDDAMTRLRSRFPHVLVLEWRPEGVVPDGRTYGRRVAQADDLAVTREFVRHVRGAGEAGAADPGECALLAEALEAGRLASAAS